MSPLNLTRFVLLISLLHQVFSTFLSISLLHQVFSTFLSISLLHQVFSTFLLIQASYEVLDLFPKAKTIILNPVPSSLRGISGGNCQFSRNPSFSAEKIYIHNSSSIQGSSQASLFCILLHCNSYYTDRVLRRSTILIGITIIPGSKSTC